MRTTTNRRLAAALATAAAALAALPAAASAERIDEFPVTAGSSPADITIGPDGRAWFTEFTGNRIGRIDATGRLDEFPIKSPNSKPLGITAGPDGALWFAMSGTHRIGRITTSGVIREFPLPDVIGPGAEGFVRNTGAPHDIATGPDGNLWFTERDGNRIGRITPAGRVTEFRIPTANSRPMGITAGPDGRMWFVEENGNKVARISTSGSISEFNIPTARSRPEDITVTGGRTLAFTERQAGKIGLVRTSGQISERALPVPGAEPLGIVAAADGALRFTEFGRSAVGRLSSTSGFSELFTPTRNSRPGGIARDRDGTIWFAEGADRIGHIVPDPATPPPAEQPLPPEQPPAETPPPVETPPVVEPQPDTPARAADEPRPRAERTFERLVQAPSTRRCASRRNFRIRVRTRRANPVVSARVFVNGRQVRVVRGSRLRAGIDLRGLPRGRFTVRIVAKTKSGAVLRGVRKYRTCTPRRPGGTPRL